jgi:hypothetical protein
MIAKLVLFFLRGELWFMDVYGRYSIVNGVYKPAYNLGGLTS